MSLLWADFPSGSQGIYAGLDSALLDGIYASESITLVNDPDPNIPNGRCVRVAHPGGSLTNQLRYVLAGSTAIAGIGQRTWLTQIPAANAQRPAIQVFRDGANNILVSVVVSPTGAIQVYRGTRTGVLLGQTPVPVLTANSWRHVETKITFSDVAGEVEVRVEGIPVLELTGQNTGVGPCAQVSHDTQSDGGGFGTTYFIKDTCYWNGSGTENNDFLGPCGVYWRPVFADVSSGWTPSSGTSNYELLDESPPDDIGYVYAGTPPPAPSIMSFDSLPPDVVSIRGLISVVRMQKSDGGDGFAQVSLSPDGVAWDDGANNAISTAFTYYRDVSEVSPDTTDPWTPVEFETLQIKINRTT